MIYFDNAATTFPKPPEVYSSILDCLKNYCANPGRGSHNMSLECELKIMECRDKLSSLFNVGSPLNICFSSNTTEALNTLIKGLFKSNDHVISTFIEHNSVLRPLNYLKEKGIESTLVPVDEKGYVSINDLNKSLKKNTKALIICHGSNVLGTIQNIETISDFTKHNGIMLILDAAQSAGFIPIDVKKYRIDALAFPGHKGLLGPQGTGGFYINPSIPIVPLKQGGTGSISHSLLQPNFLPDKMESGTLNTPGIVGLNTGINFILKKGITKIRKKEESLTSYATEELKKLPFIKLYGELDASKKCAVISFNMDRFDSAEVGKALNEHGIYVRTGYHCAPLIHKIIGTSNQGTVRISFGYFNTFEEIDKLLNCLISLNKYH